MIDEHIQGEITALFKTLPAVNADLSQVGDTLTPVLNMLNTRYFIIPLQQGKTIPVFNPHALGNAWFVEKVQYVNNANEEIEALHHVNPGKVAVVDKKFQGDVKASAGADSLNSIVLTNYEPNALKYEVNSPKGGTVVFAEIYYPGWRSFIDGKEVPHGRADYILRAMNVPAGKHVVEFTFDPKSLHVTETIAFVALGILLLAIVVAVVLTWRKQKKE